MSRYVDTTIVKPVSVFLNCLCPAPWLLSMFVQCTKKLKLAVQIKNERRVLATLSDDMLQDIGIDSLAATHESDRSFFDIPAQRKSDNLVWLRFR